MELILSIDLGLVARDLGIPREQVQRTVELLDEGNTVPFITRFRKDQTGGLDEEQIRLIQADVRRQRQLVERKQTILKSVEAQGRLTPDLAHQFQASRSLKHLEDLYLPYKPKKQTLATLARQRGLEPLAEEILTANPAATDLAARAAEFINPDLKLSTVDDVLSGVGHLMAERFSERAELRSRLRRILQRSGRLTSARIEPEKRAEAAQAAAQQAQQEADDHAELQAHLAEAATGTVDGPPVLGPDGLPLVAEAAIDAAALNDAENSDAAPVDELAREALEGTHDEESEESHDDDTHEDDEHDEELAHDDELHDGELHDDEIHSDELHDDDEHDSEPDPASVTGAVEATEGEGSSESPSATGSTTGNADEVGAEPTEPTAAAANPVNDLPGFTPADGPRVIISPTAIPVLSPGPLASRLSAKQQARAAARDAKKKKKQKLLESLYKDYYQYQEPLGKVPAHRILAINRGERAHVLRVRIEADSPAMSAEAEQLLIPEGHPHAEFLRGCVRDSLGRLVVPSLEREIRREMTERAEQHAVEVFIRNLRKLLLQPPVHGRRVLAIDPGFRSGCKLAALDEFGNLIDHSTIHVIGSEQHRQLCRTRLVEIIRKQHLSVVAIGNGTACRETEQLIADILGSELADSDIAYVVVNEAGASVYSTSPIGREELPKYDATVRGAVSIGRRLLDPLSELVKINPANIGVGLYQHDLKAKHLRDSLDEVVESCVNYVGVDVNTASPALLRYVSGLNQLTARRLYEHRLRQGPFRNREQFREVPGFGDQTFVQAAGFLKIRGGDNPLDATSIHPESYETAQQVLVKIDSDIQELASEVGVPPAPEPPPAPAADPPPSQFAQQLAQACATPPATTIGPEVTGTTEDVGDSSTLTSDPTGAEFSVATDAAIPPADVATTPSSDIAPAAEAPAVDQDPPVVATPDAVDSQTTTAPPQADPPSEVASVDVELPHQESLASRIAKVDVKHLAEELSVGTHLLGDILSALARPTRDPREDLPPPIFRRGIVKLEDLTSGMELAGTVLNVVDFGVFVDIGLSDSALIHISRLADRFIRDPHEVVGVGDVLKVWVVDVDKQRRRVSLTAIAPGSERPRMERAPRQEHPPQQQRPPQGQRPQGQRPQGQRPGGQRPGGQRPAQPPRSGGGRPPAQASGGGNRGNAPRSNAPPPKPKPPKPVRPITKGMIEGQEPMRTFSDLMQFYKKKKDEPGTEDKPSS